MEKGQFICDLKFGDSVKGCFSVKYKHPPKEYKNGFMFTIGLADKTGEIEATYWGGKNKEKVRQIYDQFKEGDVISITGVVGEFRNRLKIDINEENEIKKSTEYRLEDFVPKTEKNVDEMLLELREKISLIKNPNLRALLEAFFNDNDFVQKFKTAPAAMYIHHAYLGGLLEHTLNVVKLCQSTHKLYPQLNLDLLLAGSLLHDIGKTKEFVVTTNIKVSEEGMLRGHIVLGEEMMLKKVNKIPNFPRNLKMKLSHIILSHHGETSFGSPKQPQFAEAAAIYYADECDSKVNQYIKAKEMATTEDFRTYTKRLGEIYLK
jgi:3'-5' exoribonuclease